MGVSLRPHGGASAERADEISLPCAAYVIMGEFILKIAQPSPARMPSARLYSVHGLCTLGVSQKRQHFVGGGKGKTVGFGDRIQQLSFGSASDHPQ